MLSSDVVPVFQYRFRSCSWASQFTWAKFNAQEDSQEWSCSSRRGFHYLLFYGFLRIRLEKSSTIRFYLIQKIPRGSFHADFYFSLYMLVIERNDIKDLFDKLWVIFCFFLNLKMNLFDFPAELHQATLQSPSEWVCSLASNSNTSLRIDNTIAGWMRWGRLRLWICLITNVK